MAAFMAATVVPDVSFVAAERSRAAEVQLLVTQSLTTKCVPPDTTEVTQCNSG